MALIRRHNAPYSYLVAEAKILYLYRKCMGTDKNKLLLIRHSMYNGHNFIWPYYFHKR